jgi:glucosamine--fructose-6-phosphate aminotransferase (isomerizing)
VHLFFGVCNVVGSSISRETHAGAYTHAGPEVGCFYKSIYTNYSFTMLALRLAKAKGTLSILIFICIC